MSETEAPSCDIAPSLHAKNRLENAPNLSSKLCLSPTSNSCVFPPVFLANKNKTISTNCNYKICRCKLSSYLKSIIIQDIHFFGCRRKLLTSNYN